jgi:hypothetical protein
MTSKGFESGCRKEVQNHYWVAFCRMINSEIEKTRMIKKQGIEKSYSTFPEEIESK